MEFYNQDTRVLTLVNDVKGDEIDTNEYSPPSFTKGSLLNKALKFGKELNETAMVVSEDLFERLSVYISELYGKQFTPQELKDGIDMYKIINVYIQILFSSLNGDSEKNE